MAAKKTNCREVAIRLQSYLDGELDSERMEQIKAHLDACVDCGLEHDVFDAIKTDLSTLAVPAESDALARLRDFSSRISEEASSPS